MLVMMSLGMVLRFVSILIASLLCPLMFKYVALHGMLSFS